LSGNEITLHSEKRFGLGTEFVGAVREATASISKTPDRFQSVSGDMRIFRMRGFPFHLFCHHAPGTDCIIIHAVAHHARRPDDWRNRAKPGQ
jgi:hypothetical protein